MKMRFSCIPTGLHVVRVGLIKTVANDGEAMNIEEIAITTNVTLRRNFLKAGVFAVLLRTPIALACSNDERAMGSGMQGQSTREREGLIRTYYSGWEKKQWSSIETLLADDFTFTSPNNDDHIDRHAFRERCWPGAALIATINMECVMVHGDDGFAKYRLTTTDGKSLRNTEFFKFADGKVKDIEVYFGGKRGYPGQQA